MRGSFSYDIRRVLLGTLIFGIAIGPLAADPLEGLNRLFKKWGLFQGIQISGTNEFTFQQHFIEGSESAFSGQRWDTSPFLRRSSLSIEGPIWKEFMFRADFSASGWGPSYSRWLVGYVGANTALYYGDLNIDLAGNFFASFAKPVRGWQLDQKIGKGLARFFYSEEQAITRYQIIPGNNTSGPFFLTYAPVMQGTEVVKVDEQLMRFGVDYRLDYDTGQLWFEVEGRPPRIIPDTSRITVSYQSAGYQSGAGTLYGGRVLLPLAKERLQIGVTMLSQQRGGRAAQDTVGYQEDIFYGSGSPGPFDVNFRPIIPNGSEVVYKGKRQIIQQALLVLVDNVEQAEGVDFDAYRQIGRIIFRRSVPPTALVVIRYYYDLSSTVTPTDTQLWAADLLYHLSPQLSLQADWARSEKGQNGLAMRSGEALRMNLNYVTPRLKFTGEYRDIAPNFSFLDTTGFFRQDKGLELALNWQPARYINFSARHSDLKSAQGYSFGYSGYTGFTGYSGYSGGYYGARLGPQQDTSAPALAINNQRQDLELRLDFPGWPNLSFQRQQMKTSSSTSDSSYTTHNISWNWTPSGKPFSLSGNWLLTSQEYVPTADPTHSRGSDTQQLQWTASYRPGERFSISLSQSLNNSSATETTARSSSRNEQISCRWTPFKNLDLNYDLSRTHSQGRVSSGLYGGYNNYYGYYAAGIFPQGIADGGGIIDGGGDNTEENRYTDLSQRLSLRYSPSQKLSFDFSFMKRKYTSGGSVGYLANSDQSTQTFNVSYMLSEALSLNLAYTADRMAFLDENRGTVANNTLGIGANYRVPNSPWGLGLNFNLLRGSSPTYSGFGANQRMRIVDNNMSDLSLRLTYALNQSSEIVLTGQLSDYAGGYANFNRQQLEIGYRRKLGKFADLTFGYRLARNITKGLDDPRYGYTSLIPQNQNYIANTFMLTLSTQFSSTTDSRSRPMTTFGSTSDLRNFTGYRPATSLGFGQYGAGYGGAYGAYPFGGGYRSPFDTTPVSGSYGGYGSYGLGQPAGYEIFGSGWGGQGGFRAGLGDISGHDAGRGMRNLPTPGLPQPPEADEKLLREIETWQELDELPSLWWP